MKKTYFLITFLVLFSVLLFGYAVYAARHSSVSPTSAAQPTAIVQRIPSPTDEPKDVEENLSLELNSPRDLSTVTSPTLTVQGKTAPLSDVFVNDAETKADASGIFSTQITLDEGDNIIFVSANDAKGDYAEKQITITYQSQ